MFTLGLQLINETHCGFYTLKTYDEKADVLYAYVIYTVHCAEQPVIMETNY